MDNISSKAAKILGVAKSPKTTVTTTNGQTAVEEHTVYTISRNGEPNFGFATSLVDAQRLACAMALNKSGNVDPANVSIVFKQPTILVCTIVKRGYLYNTTETDKYVITHINQSPLHPVINSDAIDKIMATVKTGSKDVLIVTETTTIPVPPPLPTVPLIDATTVWIKMPPTPPPLPHRLFTAFGAQKSTKWDFVVTNRDCKSEIR